MIVPIQMHRIDRISSSRRAATEMNGQCIRCSVSVIRKHIASRLSGEGRIISVRRADVYQLPDAVERIRCTASPVGFAAVDGHLRGVGEVELNTIAEAGESLLDGGAGETAAVSAVHAEVAAGVVSVGPVDRCWELGRGGLRVLTHSHSHTMIQSQRSTGLVFH